MVAALNALEPLVLKYVFDDLARGAGANGLLVGLVVLAGVGGVREGLGAFANWLTWRTRLGVQHQILEATVGRLQEVRGTLSPLPESMNIPGRW